ncbi:MAG TPA: FixH family protein [Draconibacterium sp.]|nr:FixH family protein [Draconibacterium sp.]
MKFTWGTGIFLFLVLFLAGSAAFIIFAARQKVNLVHKDYYEKGVDYSEQMKVNERSKPFANSFSLQNEADFFSVLIENALSENLDSGSMYMFRPSDSSRDITLPVTSGSSLVQFKKSDLINGRYILKFTWYTNGVKYEVDRPVNIQ